MHLPVIGHGAVDLMALQQLQDELRLLDGLLHGDGLGEEVHAGLDARRHGAVDVLGVEGVLQDGAGAVAPQADPHHGELHAVGPGGLPVDGGVLAGPVLVGGHVDAEPGVIVPAGIEQPVRMVRVPHEVPLGEAAALRPGVDGDLLAAVGDILPRGLRGGVDLAGVDARPVLRLLGVLRPSAGDLGDLHGAEIPHAALDGDVLQRHGAGDAGGHDQVSGDGHVPQIGPLRRVDHHGARRVGVIGGVGLDQHLHHIVQDRHDLRPGDGVRGAEIAVGGVGDIASGGHLRKIGPGILRHLIRVQIVDVRRLPHQAEGPGDHGHRLLAGDGVPRQGRAVVAQVHAGGVELQDGLLPVVAAQV